jgi:PAS domain S-box-containing protein
MSASHMPVPAGGVAGAQRAPGPMVRTVAGDRAADVVDLPAETLLALLPEAYAAIDATTRRFVLVNDASERMLGYSRAELLTMTTADVIATADGSRLELAYGTFIPGTISRRDWVLKARDGRLIPATVTSIPIVVNGRVIIHMISHDLSDEGPAAEQRTVLAIANERLAVSLDYAATLRAVAALVVPAVADGCTIDLHDPAGRLRRVARATVDPAGEDGIAVTIVPLGEARLADDVSLAVDPASPAADPAQADDSARAMDPAHAGEPDGAAEAFALLAHGPALGTLTMRRHPPRVWDPETRSVATALARRAAQAISSALLWETAQRELARRAAILRISRAFAESEPGSDRVMAVLLSEALSMLGADHGGIALWDAPSGTLIQVYSNNGRSNGMAVSLENSLSGRAATELRPVVSNEYQREYGHATPGGRAGAEAGIAAPLLHEGRLIGVISVAARRVGHQFGPDDVEALELLAGMAASMLGTLERAQLQAVSLAARELAHRLNNDLVLAVGTIDMLRDEQSLSPELRDLIGEAGVGLQRVAEQLTRLQQLARFQTRETPVGPALDLERSTGNGSNPA